MLPLTVRSAVRRVVPPQVRRPLGIAAFRIGLAARMHARAALGRSPFLAARDRVYTDWYYATVDPETEALYEQMVEAVCRLHRPASVVDVGCGTGFMLACFEERGVGVTGVDGSKAAIRRSRVREHIVRTNLEHGVPELGRFDACLCIEVAEHLRPESGPHLVEGLTRLSDLVVFTAAAPAQSGVGHINLRPKAYWRGLFHALGYATSPLERALRDEIAAVPEPAYIHENLMVLERSSASSSSGLGLGPPPRSRILSDREGRRARDALLRRGLASVDLPQGDDGRRARRLGGDHGLARLAARPRGHRRGRLRRSSSGVIRGRSRRSTGSSTARRARARGRRREGDRRDRERAPRPEGEGARRRRVRALRRADPRDDPDVLVALRDDARPRVGGHRDAEARLLRRRRRARAGGRRERVPGVQDEHRRPR